MREDIVYNAGKCGGKKRLMIYRQFAMEAVFIVLILSFGLLRVLISEMSILCKMCNQQCIYDSTHAV